MSQEGKDILQILAKEHGYDKVADYLNDGTFKNTAKIEQGINALQQAFISENKIEHKTLSEQELKKYNLNTKRSFKFPFFQNKSYTSGTLADNNFANFGNQGVPTLPYIFVGGSLYNPWLNIATIANLYSLEAQIVPVSDCVQTIGNAFSRIEIILEKISITNKDIKTNKINFFSLSAKPRLTPTEEYLCNIWQKLHTPNQYLQKSFTALKTGFNYELQTTGNVFIIKEYAKGTTIKDIINNGNVVITNLRIAKTFEITQYGYYPLAMDNLPQWRETRYATSSQLVVNYDKIFFDSLGNLRQLGTRIDENKDERLYEIYHCSSGIGNTFVGQTKLLRCFSFIQLYYFGSLFAQSYYQNSANPSGIVQIQRSSNSSAGVLDAGKQAEFASLLRDQMKGVSNAGKLLTWANPDFNIVFTPISATVKESDLHTQMEYASNQIREIFNVPNVLRDRSGHKFGVETEVLRFYKEAVFPVADLFTDALNNMFIKTNKGAVSENYCFINDKQSIEEFRRLAIEDYIAMHKAGATTINELRERLELPPIKDGDYIPNVRPVSQELDLNNLDKL